MQDPHDNKTQDAFPAAKRGCGRPVTSNAKSGAQRQAEWRAKQRAAGRSVRVVWSEVESVTSNGNSGAVGGLQTQLAEALRQLESLHVENERLRLANEGTARVVRDLEEQVAFERRRVAAMKGRVSCMRGEASTQLEVLRTLVSWYTDSVVTESGRVVAFASPSPILSRALSHEHVMEKWLLARDVVASGVPLDGTVV